MIDVTQADRDAAAAYWKVSRIGNKETQRRYLSGEADNSLIVQAFARHRLAERAAVVEWLPKQPPHLSLQEYADAIEAGAQPLETAMTDEAKALVKRLWWGEWYFEDPFDGKAYASDDPLDAANLIETQAREIERLKEAIKVQARAVRTLQANEATEINTLRQQKREWHHAVSSLDSEREANAILTDEIERLREALKTAEAWLGRWARHIGDCPGIDGCTCGLTRVRYEAETTLASIEGAGHE